MALNNGELEDMASGPSNPDDIDLGTLDFGDDIDNTPAPEEVKAEEGEKAEEEVEAKEGEAKEGEEEVEAKEGEDKEEVKAEEEEDPKPKPREHMVPKSRLDQVLARARKAEEQLQKRMQEESEKGEEPKEESGVDYDAKFEDLATRIAEAQADGDKDALKALAVEQQQLIREQTSAELEAAREDYKAFAREEIVYNSLLDEVIEKNPVLNADDDKFDQGLVNDINDLQGFYMDKGFDRASALAKALEIRYPDALTPAVQEVDNSNDVKAKDLGKKLEAANRQPPDSSNIGDSGASHGKDVTLDPNKMTWDDWDNLSENDWDKLLGNNL